MALNSTFPLPVTSLFLYTGVFHQIFRQDKCRTSLPTTGYHNLWNYRKIEIRMQTKKSGCLFSFYCEDLKKIIA